MTSITIKTSDGISHGVLNDNKRRRSCAVPTVCGLEFDSWRYKGKGYGIWYPDEILDKLPEQKLGEVDCMACIATQAAP